MNFWDKIRQWLRGNDDVAPKQPGTSSVPTQAKLPTKPSKEILTDPDPADTVTPAGDTPIDVFQILFSHQNKYTTTMLNSITLSSDMKTLYLIDNGRAIPFDLTVPEGVIVGLLGKQLVVATAVSPPKQSVTAPSAPVGERQGDDRDEKFTFKANKNSQFTVIYNDEHQALGIIGYDDLDISISAPEDHDCKEHRFEMKKGQLIRLLNKEDVLEIYQESI